MDLMNIPSEEVSGEKKIYIQDLLGGTLARQHKCIDSEELLSSVETRVSQDGKQVNIGQLAYVLREMIERREVRYNRDGNFSLTRSGEIEYERIGGSCPDPD